LRWLEAAARQDHPQAPMQMARIHLGHAEQPERLAAAAAILRQLADGGDGEAQMQLGLMYIFGRGVPADGEEGRFWLRQAALQGLQEAQMNLGTIYARGINTETDLVQAYAWLSLAADRSPTARDARDELEGRIDVGALAAARAMVDELRQRQHAP
jgi:TPR repeat protein